MRIAEFFKTVVDIVVVSLIVLLLTLLVAELIVRIVQPFPRFQVVRKVNGIDLFVEGEIPVWIQDRERMNLECIDRFPDAGVVVFSGDSIFFGSKVDAADISTRSSI